MTKINNISNVQQKQNSNKNTKTQGLIMPAAGAAVGLAGGIGGAKLAPVLDKDKIELGIKNNLEVKKYTDPKGAAVDQVILGLTKNTETLQSILKKGTVKGENEEKTLDLSKLSDADKKVLDEVGDDIDSLEYEIEQNKRSIAILKNDEPSMLQLAKNFTSNNVIVNDLSADYAAKESRFANLYDKEGKLISTPEDQKTALVNIFGEDLEKLKELTDEQVDQKFKGAFDVPETIEDAKSGYLNMIQDFMGDKMPENYKNMKFEEVPEFLEKNADLITNTATTNVFNDFKSSRPNLIEYVAGNIQDKKVEGDDLAKVIKGDEDTLKKLFGDNANKVKETIGNAADSAKKALKGERSLVKWGAVGALAGAAALGAVSYFTKSKAPTVEASTSGEVGSKVNKEV